MKYSHILHASPFRRLHHLLPQLLFCLSFTKLLHGATETAALPKPAEEKDIEEKKVGWGVTGYPIIMYSPELKAAAGGGLVLYYARRNLRPNAIEAEFIGSQTAAIELNLKPTLYFRGNNLLLASTIEVKRTPGSDFYGLGPDTTESHKETFLYKTFGTNVAFLWQVLPNVYVGPALTLARTQADEVTPGGMLANSQLAGGRLDWSVGAGLSGRVNTTDNDFFPTHGFQTRLDGINYRTDVGSSHNFSQLTVDHRHYFSLYTGHVLALQGLATLSTSDAPWQKMPRLGGSSMMRGYYEGRYRAQHYFAAQAEYRFPIFWRFGGAVFGAMGEVATHLKGLSADRLRGAGGGGLRFLMDSDEHINLRVDAAMTDHGDFDFYVNLLESF